MRGTHWVTAAAPDAPACDGVRRGPRPRPQSVKYAFHHQRSYYEPEAQQRGCPGPGLGGLQLQDRLQPGGQPQLELQLDGSTCGKGGPGDGHAGPCCKGPCSASHAASGSSTGCSSSGRRDAGGAYWRGGDDGDDGGGSAPEEVERQQAAAGGGRRAADCGKIAGPPGELVWGWREAPAQREQAVQTEEDWGAGRVRTVERAAQTGPGRPAW